ncbi:alpha/beta hydrolase [Skermanella aerolata]|uniref:Alpha/beta hydrolase n=1 Tax=Skermanella aerolata TaxID=393310 RepID=A0A512DYY2_9PROT|nr:alpha/beta hydrolase [Skermanella aerolata]KJB92120.1 alpha/beta hydrolase [Skermanella aerolata KACC 11604]GEO41703.1 alpha/beta hydrolase [Skermanella aerolata]
MTFIIAAGRRLDTKWIGLRDGSGPVLVFLHEGLGSIELWRDFPGRIAEATGLPALVYSRHGYGRSDPLTGKRPLRYLHHEALEVLPAVLDACGVADPILIGHSDGASIALLAAGAGVVPVRGAVVMAPHVFVEDITIAGIEKAATAWKEGGLARALARYHTDPEGAFRGWNEAWLSPEFRAWNIEEYLPSIRCPLLAIQGVDDEYATLAQIDAIERQVTGPFERQDLADCRHTPWRDQPDPVAAAIAHFVASLPNRVLGFPG